MVIDNEIVGLIKRFARGFEVDEETIAFDVIKELGHKALFMSHEHTLRHFRNELWNPQIFIGGIGYDQWLEEGGKTEVDRAREKALRIREEHHPEVLDEDIERELIEIIEKAGRELAK